MSGSGRSKIGLKKGKVKFGVAIVEYAREWGTEERGWLLRGRWYDFEGEFVPRFSGEWGREGRGAEKSPIGAEREGGEEVLEFPWVLRTRPWSGEERGGVRNRAPEGWEKAKEIEGMSDQPSGERRESPQSFVTSHQKE